MASGASTERTTPRGETGRLVSYEQYIEGQLRKTSSGVKAVDLAFSVMVLLGATLAFFGVMALVDHWLVPGGLGTLGRVFFFLLLVVGVTWFVVRRIVPVLIGRINPVYAAYTIERSAPTLKNSLLNLLLFRSRQRGDIPEPIYEALEQQAASRLSNVPVELAVDRSKILRVGYVLMALAVVCALYMVLSPKNPLVTAQRIVLPWADILPPARVKIENIQPGATTAVRGERVQVTAEVRGVADDEQVQLVYSTDDGQVVDLAIPMYRPEGAAQFACNLPETEAGLQEGLVYRIEAGDAVSHSYRMDVVTAPTIALKTVNFEYPKYTKLVDQRYVRDGNLRAIEGTRVTLRAETNADIKSAWIDFGNDKRRDLQMQANGTEATITFPLELDETRRQAKHASYSLRFTSTEDRSNQDPVQYRIEVVPDLAPEIALLQPEASQKDVKLPLDGTLTVETRAIDPDFALTRVELKGKVGARDISFHTLLDKEQTGQFIGQFDIEPQAAGLQAGDVAEYWAVATDNKTPEANVAETEHYHFTVMSAQRPPQDRVARNDQPRQGDDRKNPPDEPPADEPPNKQEQPNQQPPAGQQQPPKKQPPGEQPPQDEQDQNTGEKKEQEPKDGDEKNSGDEGNKQQGDPQEGDGGGEGQQADGEQQGGADGTGKKSQRGQKSGGAGEPGNEGEENDEDSASDENNPAVGGSKRKSNGSGSRGGEQSSEPSPEQVRKDGSEDGTAIDRLQELAEQRKQQEKSPGDAEQNPGEKNTGDQNSGEKSAGEKSAGEKSAGEKSTGEKSSGDPSRANPKEDPAGEKNSPRGESPKQQPSGSKTQPNKERPSGSKPEPGAGPAEKDPSAGSPDGAEGNMPTGAEPSGGEKTAPMGSQPGEKPQPGSKTQPGAEKQPGAEGTGAQNQPAEKKQPGAEQTGEKKGPAGNQPPIKEGPYKPKEGENVGSEKRPMDDGADDGRGEQQGGSQGAGGKTKPGDTPKEGAKPGDDGMKEETGGEGEREHGAPGAGRKPKDDPTGSPDAQNDVAPKANKNQGGDEEASSETSEKAPAHGKSESNSDSSQGGTNPGGGEEGGGQPAQRRGTGSPGQNTAAEEGGGDAAEAGGDGAKSQEGGDDLPSDKKPQTPGEKKAGEGRKKQPGEDATGEKRPGGEEKIKQGEKNSSETKPGQQQPGDSGNPAGGAQGTGGENRDGEFTPGDQPPPGGETPGDEVNLEYSRKATDLVLDYLEDQLKKDKLSPEVQEQLPNWSKEDIQELVNRARERLDAKPADGQNSAEAQQETADWLRSLGLKPNRNRGVTQGARGVEDEVGGLRQSRGSRPPAEYADQVEAYKKGLNRSGGK